MDKPIRYSYSRVSAFEACPAKFKFAYIDKIPRGPTPEAFQFGTLCHVAMQEYIGTLRESGRPIAPEEMEGIAIHVWERPGDFSDNFGNPVQHNLPAAQFDEFYRVVTAFAQNRLFKPEDICATEQRIEFEWEGHTFLAFIDMVEKDENGLITVTDWKSSWKADSQAEAESSLQLRLYGWAIGCVYGMEEVRARAAYLRPRVEREFLIGPREMKAAERTLREMIARMQNATEYPATPGSHCTYCDYHAICPFLESAPMVSGVILDDEAARITAGEITVLDRALREKRASLREWCIQHGPVPTGDLTYGYWVSTSQKIDDPAGLYAALGSDAFRFLSVDQRRAKKLLRDERCAALVVEEKKTDFKARKVGAGEEEDDA